VKIFQWNTEKDAFLRKERGVGFEEIVVCIENGYLLAIEENPSGNFSNQKIMIVNVRNYAYVVPYVEFEDEIFLKTIFPSRKATKKYLQ
jgi:uncharacterized DUF497 family protein